jgi:hypothetical protein
MPAHGEPVGKVANVASNPGGGGFGEEENFHTVS